LFFNPPAWPAARAGNTAARFLCAAGGHGGRVLGCRETHDEREKTCKRKITLLMAFLHHGSQTQSSDSIRCTRRHWLRPMECIV
jgi:hypothetical protein